MGENTRLYYACINAAFFILELFIPNPTVHLQPPEWFGWSSWSRIRCPILIIWFWTYVCWSWIISFPWCGCYFQTDGGQWTVIPQVTAACVGNSTYFGGGMKITPTADPFNGRLEVNKHFCRAESFVIYLIWKEFFRHTCIVFCAWETGSRGLFSVHDCAVYAHRHNMIDYLFS